MYLRGFPFGVYALLLLALAACVPPKPVSIEGNPAAVGQMQTLAVVQFTVSPPTLPMIPLLDAAMYRQGVFKVAPRIVEIHKERVDAYAETFGQVLSRYSKQQVRYGKALVDSDKYRRADGVRLFPAALNNKEFPEALVPANSHNFFDYAKLDNSSSVFDREYLAKHPEIGANMGTLAKALEVDGVMLTAVSVMAGTGMFGVSGSRALEIRSLVFDQNGGLVASARAISSASDSAPSNTAAYAEAFARFDFTADMLARELFGE